MFPLLPRLSSLSCHCFLLKPKLSVRQISFVEKIGKIHPHKRLVDKEKHRIVYEFQYVRVIASFLKLKYTLPFLAAASIPITFALDSSGVVALYCVLGSVCQIGIIILISKFCRNLTGKIYVNKEGDFQEVIISALDESGRRLDRSHSPSDFLVHGFSTNLHQAFGFAKIFVPESNIVYKMHVKSCTFHDKRACIELFGNIF